MGTLIRTLNTADRVAAMWRTGDVAARVALDELIAQGFYAVDIGERSIVAWLDGVRFELDGTFVPFAAERAA
jgi:hypothetical protein